MRRRDSGLTLLSVLVAMAIFAIGMLALAALYTHAVPTTTANQEALDTAAFGNQFWSLLQADPQLIGDLGTSTASSYTAGTQSSAPAALQPLLTNIFTSAQTRLPNAVVTITPGPDAQGDPCSAATPSTTVCGVKLTIAWSSGSTGANAATLAQRTQTFVYQVGY